MGIYMVMGDSGIRYIKGSAYNEKGEAYLDRL